MSWTRSRLTPFAASAAGLGAGAVGWMAGAADAAGLIWAAVTVGVAVLLLAAIVGDLLRREAGVDLIALLAMVGALALGEYLAGAVIAVMLTGGEALEAYAAGRASRELTALLQRAPRVAHRLDNGTVTTVEVAAVRRDDLLLVRTGEVVPVDGVVVDQTAVLDESALTGESRPVERGRHDHVASGAVNAGNPVRVRATATADASTYAGIVRLVEQAAGSRAPFTRMADRYALGFVPLTLAIAGGAWAVSGEAVRGLAVLVVATPCPLILAAPIALTAGVSRAARRAIIVKGAGVLERLAAARTVVFDKTGTLTAGAPQVSDVTALGRHTADDVLTLAGALEQVSAHVYAAAIVRAARDRGLDLPFPSDVVEHPGTGIEGTLPDGRVRLGSPGWIAGDAPLPDPVRAALQRADLEGSSAVLVARGSDMVGVLLLDDPIRPEAGRVVAQLRGQGVDHTVMLTGDHPTTAELVAAAVGVDRVLADRSAHDKIAVVRDLIRQRGPVAMVGDGVNDAPALAGADVGIALGARGATASSEAADVVITIDRLDRLVEARRIADRSKRIAVQSVLVGMGLSIAAMGFAAAGVIAPVAGALLQEGIDLAAIGNALRALRVRGHVRVATADREISARFRAEHRALLAGVDDIKGVADRLDRLPAPQAAAQLTAVRAFLVDELLPHERAEEDALFPSVAALAGGEDPTGPLIGVHREIERLVRSLDRMLSHLPPDGPRALDRPELRRLLYGLHAILRLHFAQEEEWYVALDDGEASVSVAAAPR